MFSTDILSWRKKKWDQERNQNHPRSVRRPIIFWEGDRWLGKISCSHTYTKNNSCTRRPLQKKKIHAHKKANIYRTNLFWSETYHPGDMLLLRYTIMPYRSNSVNTSNYATKQILGLFRTRNQTQLVQKLFNIVRRLQWISTSITLEVPFYSGIVLVTNQICKNLRLDFPSTIRKESGREILTVRRNESFLKRSFSL